MAESKKRVNEPLFKFLLQMDKMLDPNSSDAAILSFYKALIDRVTESETYIRHIDELKNTISVNDGYNFDAYLKQFYALHKELTSDSQIADIFSNTLEAYLYPKILALKEKISITLNVGNENSDSEIALTNKKHLEEKKKKEEELRLAAQANWNQMVEENKNKRDMKQREKKKNQQVMQKKHERTMLEIKEKNKQREKAQESISKEMQSRYEQQKQERISRNAARKRQKQQVQNNYINRMEKEKIIRTSMNFLKNRKNNSFKQHQHSLTPHISSTVDEIQKLLSDHYSITMLTGLLLLVRELPFNSNEYKTEITRLNSVLKNTGKEAISENLLAILEKLYNILQENPKHDKDLLRLIKARISIKISQMLMMPSVIWQGDCISLYFYYKKIFTQIEISSKVKVELAETIGKFYSKDEKNPRRMTMDEARIFIKKQPNILQLDSQNLDAFNNSIEIEFFEHLNNRNELTDCNPIYITKDNIPIDLQIGMIKYLINMFQGIATLIPEIVIEFLFHIKNFITTPEQCNKKLNDFIALLSPEEEESIQKALPLIIQMHKELGNNRVASTEMQKLICRYANNKIELLLSTITNTDLAIGYVYRFEETTYYEQERFKALEKKYNLENEIAKITQEITNLTNELDHINAKLQDKKQLSDEEKQFLQKKRISLTQNKTLIETKKGKLYECEAILNDISQNLLD